MKRLDCEYHLEPGQGHLWTAHGEWTGEVDLGRDILDELRQKELTDPKACGKLLFDRLFPPGSRLREGYRATEAIAAGSGLRFCLHLDARLTKEEKALSWELVHDGERDILDHILVSEEFYSRNRNRIGEVVRHDVINDHLRDDPDDSPPPGASDHGVPIAEIALLPASPYTNR